MDSNQLTSDSLSPQPRRADVAFTPVEPPNNAVEVPPARLSDSALRALVASFILREGTDYGTHELSFAAKEAQVMRKLRDSEVTIYYDPVSESCTILPSPELSPQMMRSDET